MLDLAQEFEKLDKEQKKAVRRDGNTVVLAGPGSGKTKTLVVKVTHLLSEILKPPRGVACMTYNNDAVREFKHRLAEFGIHSSRRLFLGTVHSFCLNCVLRPYAFLTDERFHDGVFVAGPVRARALLERALNRHIPDQDPSRYEFTLTRLRRCIACEEDISGFGDSDPHVLNDYEQFLAAENLVDFEWMVTMALGLIKDHDWIRSLLESRFPWVVVDEYQDLGGPLHKIIIELVEKTKIQVFAVGDPDQTIYRFTGADSRYLIELTNRADFEPVRLKFNYRSGKKLILAGQAALAPDEPREYEPSPGQTDLGEVFFIKADKDLADHAAKAVKAVEDALKTRRVPPEEIVIFYQRRTILLDELKSELDKAQIPYFWERDERYPSSRLNRWLQDVASWAISDRTARDHFFEDLLRTYCELLIHAGVLDSYSSSLPVRLVLYDALDMPLKEEMRLRDWLLEMDSRLGLRDAMDISPEYASDLEAFDDLSKRTESGGNLGDCLLREFASDGRLCGKAVLTTFHGGKGRQFDVVVIPGLVEGILPDRRWNRARRRYDEPSPRDLSDSRRLFYVGFTRARKIVYLIHSDSYINQWGYDVSLGISRFALEIAAKLKESEEGTIGN